MSISCTNLIAFLKQVDREIEAIAYAIMINLQRLGLEIVIKIKESPDIYFSGSQIAAWQDQTANLRSSIGFVIARNGQVINEFSYVFTPENGGLDGAAKGKDFAEAIATQTTGIVLVIVAGMEYAAKVEALDNKRVLVGGQIYAMGQMPIVFERVKKNIE